MRIVVVSGIRTLRDAISRELESLEHAGYVEPMCLREFRATLFRLPQPQLLLIAAAPGEGVGLVRDARQAFPLVNVGVLALTDEDDDFITWAGIGISGYIEADTSAAAIASTVLRLASGETIFPGRLSSLLLYHFGKKRGGSDPHNPMHSLTPREAGIVELLADGLSNKEIARRLAITDATVKNHVHNILEKLDVPSRGAAAAYVLRASSGPRMAPDLPAALASRVRSGL